MRDRVDTVERPGQDVSVADVPLDDLDVDPGEVVAASSREVIEGADLGPTLEKPENQIGADEAAATGDKDALGNVL
jgi:hypothetical protein